ncbi:hypothetical protein A2634_02735 [Candidatus Amesbacteria bacterium RIFCSPHIGHO2_01_FULL_48_32]|uniref:M23ase beta-sheet core domain-containing protein n=1 Tax=Candidatus Amesbacteria bacterium RIFCSPLOWO2_01_FULL_48_25 TaxID=1797259 RepID=A0A1F4ZDG0_9BACT|nr:MAG: hypothetical protein A2634_02735 [Candidatus Amesbacteria bacterium RIFCSPHIGHO2_01_FULL_48_32]OGD04228.1 MAG: hypothetical protein A2989_01990 [Candidatus Amesbacteria bacterium RIFCSPLOWO2_01_FULL_48_25]
MRHLATVLIFLTLLHSSTLPLFAQEATPSATPAEIQTSPLPSPSLGEGSEGEVLISPTPSPEPSPTPTISDSTEQTIFNNLPETVPESGQSGQIRAPLIVRPLKKKTFRANEKLTVVVGNTISSNVKIKLFNSDGQETPVDIEIVNDTNPTVLTIRPPHQFKAGRFRLEITDPSGDVTTQDFTWGVLAINTNKSIYLPNETAKLALAVLDETGNMVCNANVTLQISSSSSTTTLSTADNTIKVNPECFIKDFTLQPDYEASYQVAGVGTYQMDLTATTSNGTHSITDSFEVRDSVPFDVERTTATRLYPPVTYPVTFDITITEDFSGTISETVPASFAITPFDGATPYDDLNLATPSATAITNVPNLGLPFDNTYPLSQGFGSQPDDPLLAEKYARYGVIGHDGVDFALPEGTGVLAVDDGIVVKADINGDYGQTVIIQHAWGKSYYGHLSLITAQVGEKRAKGFPLGLSGHTGLATGPHLHFGIKPNDNDFNNGYYGKINPLPYLGLIQQENGISFTTGIPSDTEVTTLTWNITNAKAGDKLKLGYAFKAPNISPQFYLLGPLQFRNNDNQLLFEETRRWQLAVDVGSGTNTVTPTTGTPEATGNTYTFTFSSTEVMDSGSISITVPSSGSPNWSAPQGTGGTAGYTTAVGSNGAVVGDVFDVMDSTTNWSNGTAAACTSGISADTSIKQEGSASILCNTDGESAGDWYYKAITSANWTNYTAIGLWRRADAAIAATRIQFIYDDTAGCGSEIEAIDLPAIVSANTWEYSVVSFGVTTRTAVVCYGFQFTNNAATDNKLLYTDYLLLGPGVPTFSGSGPWDISAVLLDTDGSDTVTVTYGDTSGGAGSTVTNSATAGVHTFTTKSRTSVTGTLDTIASSPTITLSTGPTNDQLMRHGAWFNSSGVEQPFTF